MDSPGFEPGASSLRRKRSAADLRAHIQFLMGELHFTIVKPVWPSSLNRRAETSSVVKQSLVTRLERYSDILEMEVFTEFLGLDPEVSTVIGIT